jgi:hypothetical protein
MIKRIVAILTLLSFICVVLVSAEIQSSCQNYPPPNYCHGGTNNIIANGTDANGCTVWACKSIVIEHYIVIDDNYSSGDQAIATNLKTYLVNLLGDSVSFSIKYRSEVSKQNLENRVTVFIYDNKALIINKETDYGIIMHDYPLAGNPAITEYLGGTIGILVIPRDSSEIIYDDLRTEMYKDCKNAGEIWLVRPQTRYTVCCPGLDFIAVISEENGLCAFDPEHSMCSDCGNGICENWENNCNCQKDCTTNTNQILRNNEFSNCPQACICEGETNICPSEKEPTITTEVQSGTSTSGEVSPTSTTIALSKTETGGTSIQSGNVEVITSEKVSVINSKLTMQTSSGTDKEIKVMPEEAIAILGMNSVQSTELKDESEKAVYSISGTKQEKILLVFPVNMNIKAKVNAQTGEIISLEKPWWSFLATG